MNRAVFCVLLALAPLCARADASRVVVPISQTMLPNGDIRYSVPVRVGNSVSVQALLDTGSTGLRILPSATTPGSYTDTGFLSVYAFSSGDKFTGTIATASVGIGAATTDEPIPIQVVNNVACMDFRPNCAAVTLSGDEYGIGGDGYAGDGFQAILGISLQNAIGAGYTENPLAHIGIKSWIIELPEPGQATDGSLILNPDAQDLQGFQFFQLKSAPSTNPAESFIDTLPACLNDISTGQSICGPATLDTGSPGIIAYVPNADAGPLWTAGDHSALAFSTGGTGSVSMAFTADSSTGTGMLEQPANGHSATILAGVLPFYDNAVFYDAANGQMGLRPRQDQPILQAPGSTPANPASSAQIIQMNAPNPNAPALPQVITPDQ